MGGGGGEGSDSLQSIWVVEGEREVTLCSLYGWWRGRGCEEKSPPPPYVKKYTPPPHRVISGIALTCNHVYLVIMIQLFVK